MYEFSTNFRIQMCELQMYEFSLTLQTFQLLSTNTFILLFISFLHCQLHFGFFFCVKEIGAVIVRKLCTYIYIGNSFNFIRIYKFYAINNNANFIRFRNYKFLIFEHNFVGFLDIVGDVRDFTLVINHVLPLLPSLYACKIPCATISALKIHE